MPIVIKNLTIENSVGVSSISFIFFSNFLLSKSNTNGPLSIVFLLLHAINNKFIANNLMNILFDPKNCIFEKYKSGDIREYKKVAERVKGYDKVEFVIAIVPDLNEDNEENPYNPFKKVWAENNIPSQMISVKTAKILKDSKNNTGLYYLHNIVLGILGKIGGIPWAIDK